MAGRCGPVSKEAVSFFVHAYDTVLRGLTTSATRESSKWSPLWQELYQAGWVTLSPSMRQIVLTDAGVAAYAALTKAAQ